jgi:hypothetical protein
MINAMALLHILFDTMNAPSLNLWDLTNQQAYFLLDSTTAL